MQTSTPYLGEFAPGPQAQVWLTERGEFLVLHDVLIEVANDEASGAEGLAFIREIRPSLEAAGFTCLGLL